MFDIKMTYNGRPFNPEDLMKDLMEETVKNVKKEGERRLMEFECPVHHQRPRITRSEVIGNKLHQEFEGCCPEFENTVREAFQ